MNDIKDFKIMNGILTKYCGEETEIQVPSSVGKEKIISIGPGAFKNLPFVTKITIPEGVTEIKGMAFSGCTSLQTVQIPNSIERVGFDAFAGCSALQGTESDKCIYLGNPETPFLVLYKVKNKKRTCCDIAQGTKIIYQEAFLKFAELNVLTLPNSITNFGCEAFKGCKSLRDVYFNGSLSEWLHIDMLGARFSQPLSNGANLYISGMLLTEMTVPADSEIKSAAFEGCISLKKVRIPKHVKSIGFVSFCNCTCLEEVCIEAGVKSIDSLAFSGCKSLHSMQIPDSVAKISQRTFMGCVSLTGVALPNTITAIEEGLFQECVELREINISESIQKIEQYAFCECRALANVHISKNVKEIASNAFSGCLQLTVRTSKGSFAETYANKKGFAIDHI